MTQFNRIFNEARAAQGFRSQEHLDAFYASFDHKRSGCPDCKPGRAWLLNHWQPCIDLCDEGRRLQALADSFEEIER